MPLKKLYQKLVCKLIKGLLMDNSIKSYLIFINIILALIYFWVVWGIKTFEDYLDIINSSFEYLVLFLYPIDLLDPASESTVLGEPGDSPAGFLRITDKNDVPIFRRKQSDGDAFSLFIAPADNNYTFVLRTWSSLSSAYLPLMRALVENNFRGK